ncbi:MAG: hypothetical protein GF329_11575 [Candidatus Lokiarchaeota archaeon]|nr:hypothetical protein [Candidatus Lokiarchaeota archaeon]
MPHKNALDDAVMKKADGTAAWISRNWGHFEIEQVKPFRKSLVLPNRKINREISMAKKVEVARIFQRSEVYKLHENILNSKLLNFYHEAKNYPYTSLKYHLLLTCSIYYNLINRNNIGKLYLCENQEPDSIFQIIYKDKSREWALLPHSSKGMSRVLLDFSKTWNRRIENSIGGANRIFNGLLGTIKSWSVALATIEDIKLLTMD